MRVLLVHPDFQRRASSEDILRAGFNPPALGINLLAEVLRERGHDVSVLDSLRLALRYGVSRMPSFENEVARRVVDDKIDAVGFNVTSPTRLIALRCARAAKICRPDVRVILGGPHPTIVGQPLVGRYSDIVDAVVCGEGEESLPLLIAAMDDRDVCPDIPGVCWSERNGGPSALLRDLDRYPMATYQGYRGEPHGYLFDTFPVMTARGCPYRCSFCYSKDFWSGRFRKRGNMRVLEELQYGLSSLGCTKVHFNDDMFSLPLERGKAILSGMLARQLRARMYCTTRIDCIDDQFLSLYEEVGGGCIYFGIESGSERIRHAMQKRLSDSDIESGMALLRQHPSVRVGFFLIFGYPGEDTSDIAATHDLIQRTRPDEVTCNIAHVHPGTELYQLTIQDGRYKFEDWLNEDREFFPFQQDPGALIELHRTCEEFEERYGRPTQRSGLIRDAGSVASESIASLGGVCTTANATIEKASMPSLQRPLIAMTVSVGEHHDRQR